MCGLQANLAPRKWEKYWCFIFPGMFVEVFLEVLKDKKDSQSLVDQYMY